MWWDEAQTFRRGVLGSTATSDDVTQATLQVRGIIVKNLAGVFFFFFLLSVIAGIYM